MFNVLALSIGAKATVVGVNAEADSITATLSPSSQRLLEMGFTPGASVQLVHRSPLGDTFAVVVNGTQILLGLAEAKLLTLKKDTQ
jgi:Fe2+ transport system protein FeoA